MRNPEANKKGLTVSKLNTLLLISMFTLSACSVFSPKNQSARQHLEQNAEMVIVTIPMDKTAGLSTINSLDGGPIIFIDKLTITPGLHTLGMACKLDNGVGLSFTMEIDFEKGMAYCDKALDPGKTCSSAYVKSSSFEAAKAACSMLK